MPKFLNLISQSGKQEFVDVSEFNKNPNAYGKYKIRMVDDSTGKNYDIPATMFGEAQKDGLRAWNMDKQTTKQKQVQNPAFQTPMPNGSLPADWGNAEMVNPKGFDAFGTNVPTTTAQQGAKDFVQGFDDAIKGRKTDGTDPWRDTMQRMANMNIQSSQKQFKDQIDYAQATGKPLTDDSLVQNLRNEENGFSMNKFGVAPTVARDKNGKPILDQKGDPVKGWTTDDVRASVERQTDIAARQRELELNKKTTEEKLSDLYRQRESLKKKLDTGDKLTSMYQSQYGTHGVNNRETQLQLIEVEKAIQSLEAVRDKDELAWNGFFRGFENTAGNLRSWDFGLSDLALMGKMEEIKGKIDKGQQLTADEQELATSKIGADTAAALEDETMGNTYRWAKIGGESLPFMADFMLTGGYRGIAVKFAREASKLVTKTLARNVLRNTGTLIGDVVGAYGMALTTQAGKTTADILRRHQGSLVVDENGNFKFEGGESMPSAIAHGLNAAAIENYTEKFGEHLNFAKAFGKYGTEGMTQFFQNLSNKGWAKTMNAVAKRGGINGYIPEVIEEEIGLPLNALITGDNSWSDVLDVKQQADILGGMAISIGAMGALGLGVHLGKKGTTRLAARHYESKLNDADFNATMAFDSGKWMDLRDVIDNTENKYMPSVQDRIIKSPALTPEQKIAANKYINTLLTYRGFNIGLMANMNNAEQEQQPARTVITPAQIEGNTLYSITYYNENGEEIGTAPQTFNTLENAEMYKQMLDEKKNDTQLQDLYSSIYVKDRDGSMRQSLDQQLQTVGLSLNDISRILSKSPFRRTDKEIQALDIMRNIANGMVYPPNEVHEEKDAQDGADLAEGTPVGDQATIDVVNEREANAISQWNQVADPDLQSSIKDLYEQGKTSNDIFDWLVANEYSDEVIAAFAELCNSGAQKDKFIEVTGQKIEEQVSQKVQQVTFAGTLNGSRNPAVIQVQDQTGAPMYVVSGDISIIPTDAGNVIQSDGLIVLRDEQGNFIQRPDTNGLAIVNTQNAEEYKNQLLTQTQEAVTAQIQATEYKVPEYNDSDMESQAHEAQQGNGLTAPQPATQPANTNEQQVQEPEQEPAIPTDEKGNLLYHKAPIEATINDLYNGALDDEEIIDFVQNNISESSKEYDKINKKKPKIGTDKNAYLQAKDAWQSQVDEAKQKLDYWNSVQNYIQQQTHTTPEEVKAAQDELSGTTARLEYARQTPEGATSPEQIAGEFVKNAKIQPEDFYRETGLTAADARKQYPGMLSNDGATIARLAEQLVQYDNDNYGGMFFKGDDMEARNYIIEALKNASSRKSLGRDMTAEEQEYARVREQQREDFYQEAYGMSYSDYLAFEEQEIPNIWRRISNFAPEQYDQMVAEYYESLPEDYFTPQNEQQNGTERQQDNGLADSTTVLPQPPTDNETGSGQREDPAAETGNGSEGDNQNEEVPGDTQGVGQNNEPQPIGEGDFGPIYNQFKGDAKGAVAQLSKIRNGEATAALHHKDIGDIDLVWGNEGTGHSDGFGLAKLLKYHPEVVDKLQEIIDEMSVVSRSENRINLESEKYKAGVRLTWNEKKKTWLLTLFEKKNSASDNTTDTDETVNNGKLNDTATQQDTVSEGKDTTKSPNSQENQQKTDKKSNEGQQEDEIAAEIKKDIEDFIAKSTHDVKITNYDEKEFEAQISVDGKPSNIVITPPMELGEAMHAEYRPTEGGYQELGDLLDEHNEGLEPKEQGFDGEHLAAIFSSVDAAINFETWLNQKNNPNDWENLTEEQKAAAIDADTIADENAKELAKDFLRGDNTSTIAEVFYREIVGRYMDNEEAPKKKEEKPSKPKPSNITPTGQAESDKPNAKPKEEKPKTETPPTTDGKSDVGKALDEFKDVMARFRKAGRADANVSLIGLNARQIEMLGEVFRATAKLGYALIKSGTTTFENWLEAMKAQVSDIIKANSNWNDQDISELLTETWNNKYLADGERKPLSQWAAEEALAVEQKQEKDQPAETPEAPVVEQTKAAERKFVDNVAAMLTSALETGEKPYASITALRKAAREAGMEVGENGETDIKIQELVEDALVSVARGIMRQARIPGQREIHRFRKETFEKIKLLYNLQPTISMRSSNRVALQQYSTPLPMAFVADMFATGKIMRMFFSALEPTAGNGMLVFGIDAKRVHVNEIDENRLENLQGQGFKEVTSQDATQPFKQDQYYDAIITNPPFGEAEAKDYDGYKISGLAQQIALNALSKMRDFGKAVIIIGGKQEFAPNGAIKNDKPFLTYLYNHYNVKGVIDMEGSLYAKQGTTFPTRMILIDGRRTDEERVKSDVYPPTIKDWLPKADSFDKLYDTVKSLMESKEKTNGTEIVRTEDKSLQPDRGVTLPGNTDKRTDSRKPVQDVAATGRGHGPNRSNGKDSKRDNPELDIFGGVLGGSGELSDKPANESGTGGGSGRRTGRDNGPAGEGVDNRLPVVNDVPGVQGTTTRGVGLTQEQEDRKLESEKLPYRPHNGAFSLESLAPAAMVEAMDKTLKRIEEEYGNIDEFVTNELGYDSVDTMHKALAAEQVDSVAMAIYNMKKGEALIIGDQTGVGKGRQMAALIRWAVRQGKKPIFMTQKSNLFNDIYRDLKDIGSETLKPFIFNSDSDAKIVEIYENENGDEKQKIIYRTASEEEINEALKSGKIPDDCDFVLCTYSQISTGDETSKEYENQLSKEDGGSSKRRRSRKQNPDAKPKSDKKAILLRKLAKDNYLMLDESHTAAGESNQGFYMQTLVRDSKAVTFASATYAKRPDTMPLYALRTAMAKANIGMQKLIEAIQKGGVTLQEIMSRALTNAGQMVRRERDMEGVVTDWKTIDDPETVKKARENYDKTIKAFNAIIDFQNKYINAYIDNRRESLATIAGNAGFVKGTEKMGINNTPFASKTYNYTKQLMLALKVDAIVDEVDRQIKAGRKPVIALDNTMGALFDKLTPGEEVTESTFAENLLRGLDSVMQYSQDSGRGGKKTSIKINPSELDSEGEIAYYELVSFIKESTKDIFISPLDEITAKLRAKGYTVGELTGRKNVVVEDNGTYRIAKRGKISKQLLQSRFNSGKIDVVILNKTGSTGISLHASKTFADQRQRVMILAQPLPDINDYMQMIGRIDRTGQVKRGYYINLGLPVPAEQRFLMMLSTKLKSLNANTTTSQESKDNKVEAPDMLNKYGSQVIVEYFKDHPEVYNKLDDPLNVKTKAGGLSEYKPSYDDEDARKLTGQVALLSTDEQQAFYDDVIERYNNLIKYLDDSGTNDLKITSLPLNATTLARAISSEGNDPAGDNPFAQNAYVERVEMDVLRKPMKASEIKTVINTINKGKDPKQAVEDIKTQYENEYKEKLDKQKRKYEAELERNKETLKKFEDKINGNEKMSEEDKKKAIEEKKTSLQQDSERKNDNAIGAIEFDHERMVRDLDLFKVGSPYLIPDNLDSLAFDLASPGIFLGFKAKENGITPSSTVAVFATLDGRRRVEVKLSERGRLSNINETTNQNYDAAQEVNLDNWDNNIPNITRKTGYIITGNILQAINDSQDENGNFTGQLVSYTDSEGNIHDGVLMPDKWEPTMLLNAGRPISSVRQDIESGKFVRSMNGEVEIYTDRHYGMTTILLRVPKSKKLGAKYYENEDLRNAIDKREFYQKTGKFQVAIPNGKLDEVLSVLSRLGVKVPSDVVKQLNESSQQSGNSRISPEDLANSELDETKFRLREEPAPKKTGIGYKVFVLKNGNAKPSEELQSKMREKAKSLAKSLNVQVEITTSDKLSGTEATAKGFYNPRSGKVVIVLDNNSSALDIEQTVVHEIIGHKGLRGLLGKQNYYKIMNAVYDNLPQDEKDKINEAARRNGWQMYTAIDEYLADQAEDMVWDAKSASLWQNVKHYLAEALRTLGFIIKPNLKDARYWLWLSKNQLKRSDVMSSIERNALLAKLDKLGLPEQKVEEQDYLGEPKYAFRNGSYIDSATYDAIEENLKKKSFYWKEAFIDYMQAYQVFQNEMAKGLKNGLMDNQNALIGENALTSAIEQQQSDYMRMQLKPLQDIIKKLQPEFGEGEEGIRNIENYLMMKHGLERNRVLFMRDWFAAEASRKIENDGQLTPEGQLIYTSMYQSIWYEYTNGNIDEAERDKQLKIALNEAHLQYLNDVMSDFNSIKNIELQAYDWGIRSLAEAYKNIDDFINQHANFEADKQDKSGLTALKEYFSGNNYEDAAIIDQVQSYDDMIGSDMTDKLMEAVQAVSQFALDEDYKNGLVTKEGYNRAKNMFRYYIPLRGFDETTMEDVYEYMTYSKGTGAKSLVHAKGRSSRAGSPLATAANMALNAIARGLRNQNKQRAYRLVNTWLKDNPTSVPPAIVTDLWVGLDANGNDTVFTPGITDDMTAEEIRDEIEKFKDKMRIMEGLGKASKVRSEASFRHRFSSDNHKNEHIVPLMINGKAKMIIFNGNPRPAQALRGDLAPTVNKEFGLDKFFGKLNRIMAAAFTSYNPTFMVTNLLRDTGFANNNIAVKEGGEYYAKFLKNQASLLTKDIGKYAKLKWNYDKGIAPRNEMEQYFSEFMKYGGKTGFVNQHDIAKLEKKLASYNEQLSIPSKAIRMINSLPQAIKAANERIENVNRLATYVTSRQMGRSVMRSIYDAKEVSVNFNRKGAAGNTGRTPNATASMKLAANLASFTKGAYLFFNTGVQSLNLLSKNIKGHPIKSAAYIVGIPMLLGGFVFPMLNQIIAEAAGDGDDDPYANLPEWTRRNNFCFYLGNGRFLKIPLPIELRAFYGLGDIAAGYLVNEHLKSEKNVALDVASQLTQILPVDFLGEGGSVTAALTPDAMKPMIQIATNTDWTGKPIYKDSEWNKYEPEYTKAFKNEFEPFINLSKFINEAAGGSDHVRSDIEGEWNNPAIWHAVIQGYGGGAVMDVVRVGSLSRRLATMDSKGLTTKEVPIVKAIFETPSEKTQYYRMLNKFYSYQEKNEKFKHDLKALGESASPLDHAKFLRHTDQNKPSREMIIRDRFREYDRTNKFINKVLDNPNLSEADREALEQQAVRLKVDLVKILDQIED